MSENKNSLECNAICWIAAAIVGFVAMIMFYMLADFSVLQSIFTGGLIGFLLGLVLSIFICRGQKSAADLSADEKPAQRYAREAAERKERRVENTGAVHTPASGGASGSSSSAASGSTTPSSLAGTGSAGGDAGAAAPSGGTAAAGSAAGGAGSAAAASGASDASTSSGSTSSGSAAEGASAAGASASTGANTPSSLMGSGVKPSTPLKGEAELASRKGAWKYEGEAAKPAAKAPAKAKPAPVEAEAAPAAPKEATPKATSSEPAAETAPQLYTAPPSEGADDLKLISGVGPKLEGTLNDMGIYRFEQVAVWGPGDIAWVDARLRFKGRIERDDWMSQAKILAEGGQTEFSSRKK